MLRPRLLLHAEGLAVLALSVFAYARMDASWLWFAILFLSPDLFMAGYFFNPRVGAFTYNLVHTYIGPIAAYAILLAVDKGSWSWLPMIWTAHIGFDRLMGYGLKNETAFKDTHLQRV